MKIKSIPIILIFIVITGCQARRQGAARPGYDPYRDFTVWAYDPDLERLMLSYASCESIDIRPTKGGPPVKCCAECSMVDRCSFLCSWQHERGMILECGVVPDIKPAISTGILLSETVSVHCASDDKVMSNIKKNMPWIRDIRERFLEYGMFLTFTYTARRCLERYTPYLNYDQEKCLRWGEEEEFEQGFYCDFQELRSREKLNLDLADN